jgi:hypothetical protein
MSPSIAGKAPLPRRSCGKQFFWTMDATPMNDPREEMREVQRMADRVCTLILSSDLPAIDIEIEKDKVRQRCLELYPDREQLYEMVYESRFRRLWDQFRGEGHEE